MSNSYILGRLYARPSFIEGVARNIDMGNTLQMYNESPTELEADSRALKNDWCAVGEDLRLSVKAYEQEQKAADI